MKVLHISSFDVVGGAARAAHKLHIGLRLIGVESDMLVLNKTSMSPNIFAYTKSKGLKTKITRRLVANSIALDHKKYICNSESGSEKFSNDRSIYFNLQDSIADYDIIQLHWIAGFVDFPTFLPAITKRIPVVWRLADMNAFTGGCHYDQECGEFRKSCGNCPQISKSSATDLSAKIFSRKHKMYSSLPNNKLHFVALSQWMNSLIDASPLVNRFPSSVIPNGVNLDEFRPIDKCCSRDILGIPSHKKVIMVVADNLNNPRKGMQYVIDALKMISNMDEYFLLIVGGVEKFSINMECCHLGQLSNNRFMAVAYSAADLLLFSSLQENFPNTVLESMACGTPVAGFCVGGVSDIVVNGIHGVLTNSIDSMGMFKCIDSMFNNPDMLAEMSNNCVLRAKKIFGLNQQAHKYKELYENMCQNQKI